MATKIEALAGKHIYRNRACWFVLHCIALYFSLSKIVICNFVHATAIVTLPQLVVVKYKDEALNNQKVRIISSAKHKWKDIASLICTDANKVCALEKQYSDPSDCLRQVFIDCFISNKPEKYTQDWYGLIELLDDVDLGTLAEQVRQALLYNE